jgi:hypothetical protein
MVGQALGTAWLFHPLWGAEARTMTVVEATLMFYYTCYGNRPTIRI